MIHLDKSLLKLREPAPRYNFFHLILRSYDRDMVYGSEIE